MSLQTHLTWQDAGRVLSLLSRRDWFRARATCHLFWIESKRVEAEWRRRMFGHKRAWWSAARLVAHPLLPQALDYLFDVNASTFATRRPVRGGLGNAGLRHEIVRRDNVQMMLYLTAAEHFTYSYLDSNVREHLLGATVYAARLGYKRMMKVQLFEVMSANSELDDDDDDGEEENDEIITRVMRAAVWFGRKVMTRWLLSEFTRLIGTQTLYRDVISHCCRDCNLECLEMCIAQMQWVKGDGDQRKGHLASTASENGRVDVLEAMNRQGHFSDMTKLQWRLLIHRAVVWGNSVECLELYARQFEWCRELVKKKVLENCQAPFMLHACNLAGRHRLLLHFFPPDQLPPPPKPRRHVLPRLIR